MTQNNYEPDDSRYCPKCKCIMAFDNHKWVNEGRSQLTKADLDNIEQALNIYMINHLKPSYKSTYKNTLKKIQCLRMILQKESPRDD